MRRFRIPTAIYDKGSNILRKDLRRLYYNFLRHRNTKEETLAQGFAAIETIYVMQLSSVRAYAERRNIMLPDDANEIQLLKDTRAEAEERWRRIVQDM